MKTIALFLGIALCIISCKCQEQSNINQNNEKMIIKQFDTAAFHAKKRSWYEFINAEGMKVMHEVHYDTSGRVKAYYERMRYPNSPFETVYVYAPEGYLRTTYQNFSNISIGFYKRLDREGNIIEQKNYDAPYPFTVEMLIEKMQKEYEIDLLTISEKFTESIVSRYVEEKYLHIPLYTVRYFGSQDVYIYIYLIDGNTGKTLYISRMIKDGLESTVKDGTELLPRKPLVLEYLDSLKEQE